jgi:hypothetical protein
MGQIPEPVKNAVNSIIKSQKTMEHLFGNETEKGNEIGNEIIETISSPKPSRYISTDEILYQNNVDSLGKDKQEQYNQVIESSETPVLSTNVLYKSTDFSV